MGHTVSDGTTLRNIITSYIEQCILHNYVSNTAVHPLVSEMAEITASYWRAQVGTVPVMETTTQTSQAKIYIDNITSVCCRRLYTLLFLFHLSIYFTRWHIVSDIDMAEAVSIMRYMFSISLLNQSN